MILTTESLWNEHYSQLHSFILNRVGNKFDADDILQDVFLRIHTAIDGLKDFANIQGWIYQAARNAVIDHYRMKKPLFPLPESISNPEIDNTESVRTEIASWIIPLISVLPEKYREALILSEVRGLPQKEIAERLNISLSGAKSRIQRGRAMIKETLVECCIYQFDRRGKMINYESQCGCDN